MIRVGVDVGGTFTDLVLEAVGADGRQQVYVHKVSSTPKDQSIGVVQGVVELCTIAGIQPGQIDALFHGTTVGADGRLQHEVGEGAAHVNAYPDHPCIPCR